MNKVVIDNNLKVYNKIDSSGLSEINSKYASKEEIEQKKLLKYHYGEGKVSYFQHGFMVAAHIAFANHFELTIKPDDILQCVLEMVGEEINKNPKKYKNRVLLESSLDTLEKSKDDHKVVTKDDKIRVVIVRNDYIRDVTRNPWEDCFEEFSEKIGELTVIKPIQFTTSTPIDLVSRSIATMDSVKSYIQFEVCTKCGIRAINRLGTREDWLNMEYYAKELLKLVDMNKDKFFNNLMSDDPSIWNSFYVYRGPKGSGGPYRGGWITDILSTMNMVKSSVPFIWDYLGERIPMHFITGFGDPEILEGSVNCTRYWGVQEDSLMGVVQKDSIDINN